MNETNSKLLDAMKKDLREKETLTEECIKNAEEAKSRYIDICMDVLNSIKRDAVMVYSYADLSFQVYYSKLPVYTAHNYTFYMRWFNTDKSVSVSMEANENDDRYRLRNREKLTEAIDDAERNKAIFEFLMHKETVITNLITEVRRHTKDDLNHKLNESIDSFVRYQNLIYRLEEKVVLH